MLFGAIGLWTYRSHKKVNDTSKKAGNDNSGKFLNTLIEEESLSTKKNTLEYSSPTNVTPERKVSWKFSPSHGTWDPQAESVSVHTESEVIRRVLDYSGAVNEEVVSDI